MSAIDYARFGHVNLTGHDWRRLAGSTRMSSAASSSCLSATSAAPTWMPRPASGRAPDGRHLRLPGARRHRPYARDLPVRRDRPRIRGPRWDRPGWGHVAFQVPDVPAAVDAVVAAGGPRFGEVVTMRRGTAGTITWVYTKDPDGNLVELQAWS